MSPNRFVLASVSLPAAPSSRGESQGLCFSWQASAASSQLLAFINAPISLSFVDGPGAVGNSGNSGLAADEPKPWERLWGQPRSDTAQESQAAQQDQALRPRFPPWKQLTLTPPKLPGVSSNRHIMAEQGTVDDSGCVAVESCSGRRRRVYMPRGGGVVAASVDPGPSSTSTRKGAAAGGGETAAATGAGPAVAGTGAGGSWWEGFEIVDERQTHEDHLRSLVHAYLLPNGFPDSVAPQYAPYMAWRGVQYFFGGAISVFTTQSLLGALGVAGRYRGEAAAAINWVIKDGAGRLGRLLFARWGRELDCELKQFRLMGDLLMEAGAALELATIYAPPAFLPLACTANLSKNLAAVAASSTRAPIYRTFALQNNLADITAKGESVANLADILGTVAGILLSRAKLPRMYTFAVLSAGYLLASRKEVDSVELPYMNRARLAYASRVYLNRGSVPGVAEANHNEPLLPWGRYNQNRLVLGASVEAACAGPSDLAAAAATFREGSYLVTYRPDTKKAYVLLREGATSADCLQASFFGHVFLHIMDGEDLHAAGLPLPAGFREALPTPAAAVGAQGQPQGQPQQQHGAEGASSSSNGGSSSKGRGGGNKASGRQGAGAAVGQEPGAQEGLGQGQGLEARWPAVMARTRAVVAALYPHFIGQAEANGWKLQQTMLNPRENRLLRLSVPLQV